MVHNYMIECLIQHYIAPPPVRLQVAVHDAHGVEEDAAAKPSSEELRRAGELSADYGLLPAQGGQLSAVPIFHPRLKSFLYTLCSVKKCLIHSI